MARGRAINFRPKAVLWAVLIQSESEWFRRFILRNENFVGKNEKKFYAQNRWENNISKVFGLKKKKKKNENFLKILASGYWFSA